MCATLCLQQGHRSFPQIGGGQHSKVAAVRWSTALKRLEMIMKVARKPAQTSKPATPAANTEPSKGKFDAIMAAHLAM